MSKKGNDWASRGCPSRFHGSFNEDKAVKTESGNDNVSEGELLKWWVKGSPNQFRTNCAGTALGTTWHGPNLVRDNDFFHGCVPPFGRAPRVCIFV